MRPVRIPRYLLPLLAFAVFGSACVASGPTPSKKPPDVVVTRMTALRVGPLHRVDGCLQIGEGEDSRVLVWPPDFEVTQEDDTLRVFYDDHEVEVRLGQTVSLGGGEVKSIEAFDERTRERVPAGCPPPYWLVGSIRPADGTGSPGGLAGLVDTDWRLVSLNGERLIEGTEITLRLTEPYLQGTMTCNVYGGGPDSGGYTATADGELAISEPLAVTVQLCSEPEGVMEQEAAYMETLQRAAAYQIALGTLQIADASGDVTLVFERRQ